RSEIWRPDLIDRGAVCVTRHEQTVPNKYRQRALAWASSPVQVLACPWHGVRPGAIVPPRYRKRWLDLRSRLPVAWTCDSVPADCMCCSDCPSLARDPRVAACAEFPGVPIEPLPPSSTAFSGGPAAANLIHRKENPR